MRGSSLTLNKMPAQILITEATVLILDKRGRYYRVAHTGDAFRVCEILSGREVAFAALRGSSVASVVVYDAQDRRRGIATALYAFIERKNGITLKPSRVRRSDGKAFWQTRRSAVSNISQNAARAPVGRTAHHL